jgi:uncharacterized protein YndB with AHSA1/START domain
MADSNLFTITRTFNAPRELVWSVWTEAEHLARWFGPKGLTTHVHKMELKNDGIFLYSMRSDDGFEMWARWIFRDIKKPESITLIQTFSDPNGGIARYPEMESWPLHTLSKTTFSEIDGKTTVNLQWSTYEADEAEVKIFNEAFSDMNNGWSETLNQLEIYLNSIQR